LDLEKIVGVNKGLDEGDRILMKMIIKIMIVSIEINLYE